MSDKIAEGSRSRAGIAGGLQLFVLVVLRVAIGWHFLYEGVTKVLDPEWTSRPYLESSRWVFADLFAAIAAHPTALKVVDLLNAWGLTLIGAGLIAGLFARAAAASGALLLLLYYLAHPPFIGIPAPRVVEGNYLFVDKNLVELFALIALAIFPTGGFLGLDRYLAWRRRRAGLSAGSAPDAGAELPPAAAVSLGRRELLKSLATMPVLGAFVIAVLKKRGWESYEETRLKEEETDAVTSATIKKFKFTTLEELKAPVPHAAVGKWRLSRLILGGNLIGGWAHARDLIYVSKLVKAYHTDERVFETLLLAEKCGITALLTNPILCRVINEYWKRGIGKIQFISDCGGADLLERVQMSIDNGAAACYVQGETADALVRENKVGVIEKALQLIRDHHMPAGIGAHRLETIQACVERGLAPDFWMKTLHHLNYWSAKVRPEHDNVYCREPEETIAFFKERPEPWIAFKTLAAGAIDPKEGLRFAFGSGADFVCLGMYDFQIVDDVNLLHEVFAEIREGKLKRERPWRAESLA